MTMPLKRVWEKSGVVMPSNDFFDSSDGGFSGKTVELFNCLERPIKYLVNLNSIFKWISVPAGWAVRGIIGSATGSTVGGGASALLSGVNDSGYNDFNKSIPGFNKNSSKDPIIALQALGIFLLQKIGVMFNVLSGMLINLTALTACAAWIPFMSISTAVSKALFDIVWFPALALMGLLFVAGISLSVYLPIGAIYNLLVWCYWLVNGSDRDVDCCTISCYWNNVP